MAEPETYVWKCRRCGRCKDRKIGDNPDLCTRCAENMWSDDAPPAYQSRLSFTLTLGAIFVIAAAVIYSVVWGS